MGMQYKCLIIFKFMITNWLCISVPRIVLLFDSVVACTHTSFTSPAQGAADDVPPIRYRLKINLVSLATVDLLTEHNQQYMLANDGGGSAPRGPGTAH